jgi:Ni,Fe-hydrogenase III small subunit/ferredoxin
MAWISRGLRAGIVTTRYPKRPDNYGSTFRSSISVQGEIDSSGGSGTQSTVVGLCPVGALAVVPDATEGGRSSVTLDRGRCVLCGRCVEERPDLFAFDHGVELASLTRSHLIIPNVEENPASLEAVRSDLDRRVKALRRSVHIRHVDCGSDGAEEWEINALGNPIYDVQRLGIYFTATPRHADILLMTGVGTAGMAWPARRTFEAMPDPKVVIATGADAISGGLITPTYVSGTGVDAIVPVDVWVPGSPPSPFSILHGILLAIGLLPRDGEGT